VTVQLTNKGVPANLYQTNLAEWERLNNSLSQDLAYILGTPPATVEYQTSDPNNLQVIQFRLIDDPTTGVTGLT